MMSHTTSRSLFAAGLGLALLVFAPETAHAQSDRRIREELAFARGLAAEWQFVEMAEGVLLEIDDSRASDRVKEEISLTRCEVYASGARRERDESRREELFDQALEAYREYLDENRYAENRPSAERDLVTLARGYGLDLFNRAQEALGEEAERLRGKVADVLDDALERTADLTDNLQLEIEEERRNEGATQTIEAERYGLMLARGQMLLTLAEVSEEGTYFYEKARETLENTMIEAGEDTGLGLEACLMLGQVYASEGAYDEAAAYIEFVVDTAIPLAALNQFDELSSGEKDARWRLVDKASGPLVDAFRNAGDIETACAWGLHFQNLIDTYGFQVSRPGGYLSMLAVAKALLDSGGYVGGPTGNFEWFATREEMESAHKSRRNRRSGLDLALSLALQTNRDNRGNTLQLAAQKVISEITDRGVAVAPEVLFEAAQGAYFEDDFVSAIDGFKRVLAILEEGDEATRTRLGPEVIWHLGRCFQKSGRQLEAAMAFRTGLEPRWKGDIKFDEENAKRFYSSIKGVRSAAGDDGQVASLVREGEDLILEHTPSDNAGDILFRQAENKYAKKEYEGALAQFREVAGNATNYEKALVYAALCVKKTGDPDTAVNELSAYLEEYIQDPLKQPTDESGKQVRKEAMGLATYHLGLTYFERAEGGRGSYEDVIATLAAFTEDYPDQGSLGAGAMLMVVDSNLKSDQLGDAEAALDLMISSFPQNLRTGVAANYVYKAFVQKVDADPDAAEANEWRRRAATNLGRYNQLATKKTLNNPRIEAGLWEDIGEWGEVERVLDEAVRNFPDDPALPTSVLPKLGHAKMQLRKVREASDLLAPLVEPNDAQPSPQAARDYALAQVGWVDGAGADLVEIPGVGDAESIERAATLLTQLANRADTYTCRWYELKFEVAYAFMKWGQFDGKKRASAKSQLTNLLVDLENDFGLIDEACGDATLSSRFEWLQGQL